MIRGFGPEVAPAALGFGVTAFVTLEIRQRYGHDPVAAHLADIPEVLEAHTITGAGDLLCRIVARSNADLQRVIDQIVAYEGIVRASTIIALAEQIPYRTLPLVRSPPATADVTADTSGPERRPYRQSGCAVDTGDRPLRRSRADTPAR